LDVNRFIFNSLNLGPKINEYGYDIDDQEFTCAWCGRSAQKGFKKNIISNNFTNWDLLDNPSSEYICKYCSYPFLGSKIKNITYANGHEENLRRLIVYYHFIATENEFIAFKNDRLPHYLFNLPVGKDKPFVFCITYSYKKHNAFRGVINYSRDHFKIRIETKVVDFKREKAETIMPVLWELYLYFTKEEITKQYFPTHKILQMGVDKFEELKSKQANLEHGFRELLVTVMDSEKRQEAVKEIRNQRKDAKKQSKKIKKFIDKELESWKEKSEISQLRLF
jgi:hypothetical protein